MPPRVLVVGDPPSAEDPIAAALREGLPGAEIAVAADAPALELGLARGVDAVVVRERLSGADARGVLDAVRARRRHSPVILVAAALDAEAAVEAMKAGFDDVVAQPPPVDRLARAVQATLDRAAGRPPDAGQGYRQLFENLPVGLYRSTPAGRLVDANPALVELLGYPSKESLLAIDLVRDLYVDPAERQRWQERLEKDGVLRRHRYQVRRRDGALLWVENTARAIRDRAGRVLYYEGSLEDVTARVEAEAARCAAAQAQARLTAILEATPDFVGIADRERRPIYINRAGRAMLGLGEDEDLSRVAIAEVHPDAALILEEAIPAAIREGVWSGESAFRSRSGRLIPVSQVILAHKDAAGELEFLSTIARDVSERKRAEEMIRRQAEFSERLIDSSVDGIVAFDRECRFTIWNATMERVTGLGEAQTLGRSAYEALPFLKETGDDLCFFDALAGKTVVARDRPYLLPGGRRGYFEGHFSPLLDDAARVVGGLAIIRDVTERRSLEEQLRQSQKLEAVGRLAAGVAHDFNNVRTVISGCAELLQLGLEPGDVRHQYAQEVLKAADKAAALTQQLLAFSRQQVLQPRALDLNAVLLDMEALLRRLVGQAVELVLVTAMQPAWVEADPSQLEQVILNLAVNARDAMGEGGRLVLEVGLVDLDAACAGARADARPGPHVQLAVSDTGAGMDPALREKIFEPFFTTKKRGTGLGLATVYGIVTQSGGHIAVESEPGRGSTFRVCLPRAAEPARAGSAGSGELRGGPESVLLVEDDERLRRRARLILASYGYTVLEAADAAGALRLGEQHPAPIHLLLTDVVLPEMSGPEIAARVAIRRPGLRVVYMSGHSVETIRRYARLDEGAAFLRKPFTNDALVRKVREILDAPVPS